MGTDSPSEGKIPFNVPGAGKPCHTWYKIVGDLKANHSKTPLITLHGGPSACHEMLAPLADLHERFDIPVIFYDQIGNGKSTHLREKAGDYELDNLIDYLGLRAGFDLYGQSWGGMLAARYAASQPRGLRKLVIANAPASVELVVKGIDMLIRDLPEEVREAIERCEREGTTESEEYKKAMQVFNKRHVCRLDPVPEELKMAFRHIEDDMTVVNTIGRTDSGRRWGGDTIKPTGNLKDWTVIADIPKIQVQTFVFLGRYDQVQDVAVIPFFELLPKVKWVTLENSSHVGFFEERKRYVELLGGFLAGFSCQI
ncbi:L-amino acid amidase [Lachnellula suecica]|uniref:L-amino acid amidase n=1 Tax=Lachnellula suecica TaxID=602035 RepID=A0A8T9CB41_9HELO|nr:L-amino acid amidase [Lachnellula suecica]